MSYCMISTIFYTVFYTADWRPPLNYFCNFPLHPEQPLLLGAEEEHHRRKKVGRRKKIGAQINVDTLFVIGEEDSKVCNLRGGRARIFTRSMITLTCSSPCPPCASRALTCHSSPWGSYPSRATSPTRRDRSKLTNTSWNLSKVRALTTSLWDFW